MPELPREIFRPDALQRYTAGRDQAIALNLARPRVFLGLWVLLALLLLGTALLCMVRIPVYTTGQAVVIAPPSNAAIAADRPAWLLILPAQGAAPLQVGQTARLLWNAGQDGEEIQLLAVEPNALSPAAVSERYRLQGAAATVVTEPVWIGLADFKAPTSDLPAENYLGSVATFEMQTGSQSVLALAPYIGDWFRD